MTPLFRRPAWWVWTGETKGSSAAWIFYFNHGYGYWLDRNTFNNLRAFAVRSGVNEVGDAKNATAQFKPRPQKPSLPLKVPEPFVPRRVKNKKDSKYPHTRIDDIGP